MSTQTDALIRFFAAVNRNDMQAITQDFDLEIVRIELEGFPTAGTYRGITEVQEHVTKGSGTCAEGTCEPENFFVNGDKGCRVCPCLSPNEGHGRLGWRTICRWIRVS